MPAVKVFGLTVRSFLRFYDAIENLRRCTTGMARTYRGPMSLFAVIMSSLLAVILPAGVFVLSGAPDNQAFALTLLLFLTLAPGLSLPVLKLLYLGSDMRQVATGVERIDAILDEPPMPEPERPSGVTDHTVTFENVSFSYEESKTVSTRREALRDVSFNAEEGAVTALVGPSGSGKSTLASLAARFWDPGTGSVRIGGTDLRAIGTDRLMTLVAFVFQDVHLFFDTIAENIRMGRPGATDEEVRRAARLACCHDFIEALPQGYATKIGEGGTFLSGGEAQRIAIARAVLKDAPILVLDEATAFADPENELNIQRGLTALMRGRTVIVVAHRLSTIREADQIIVLEEGRVTEKGRHEELLANNNLYARMWAAHTDAADWTLMTRPNANQELKASNI
jgi:ABC-type multidrug transport system, ATPase and permease components